MAAPPRGNLTLTLIEDSLRALLAALQSDQPTSVGRLLTEDASLEVPGRSRLRGRYLGREGIAAFLRRRRQGLDTMEVFGEDLLASADHAILLYAVRARRGDESLQSHELIVALPAKGGLGEMFLYIFDQEAFDRFWA